MEFLTLKRHNSFQNKSNRKITHSFATKRLVSTFQQEVLRFNDIFMIWS